MFFRNFIALSAVAVSVVALPAGLSPASGRGEASAARSCEALAGQVIGELRIASATWHRDPVTVPARRSSPEAEMPPHCLVAGVIDERIGAGGVSYGIGFELALPRDWNGRFLLMGGGGLNGAIRTPVGPVAAGERHALARGFAVASHDSGHLGEVFDRSFIADQRASLDFAESSVRTVTLATRDLAGRFYGKAPHHSYLTGCSTGGREGMLASQRYPELFDGIIVGAPAMRPGHSNLGTRYAQVMLNRTVAQGGPLPAGFSAGELAVVRQGLLQQCDARDGLADGMIMNVEACRSFDPAALQCRQGQSEGCLAANRADALAKAFAGPREASGRPAYVPIPWDTGITWRGEGLPGYIPTGTPGVFGPANAGREIDVDAQLHEMRMDAVGRLTDTAYWTNLSTFLDRGSKIMFYHGVSDPWFSAFDTWDYFQRARAANGAGRWGDAARFYMVPGMMHCSGGDAFEQFDMLTPLVDWVENGNPAEQVEAVRSSGRAGAMPLCPHPAYAHYTGGDPARAGNFSCRLPQD